MFVKLRNIVLTLLISLLIFSNINGRAGSVFDDVADDYIFNKYIVSLYDRGVISGYSDNTFRPDEQVSRGQMAKFVKNALGLIDRNDCEQFSDVPFGYVFYDMILSLKCWGIVSGYGDGTFRPDQSVTRAEATKFIIVGGRVKNGDNNYWPNRYTFTPFNDVNSQHISFDYVMSAFSNSMIGGYADGTFRPNEFITRGQMSKIVDIARGVNDGDMCFFAENGTLGIDKNYFTKPVNGNFERAFAGCTHDGVDISTTAGTSVKAIANGTVEKKDYHSSGYGNFVMIKHILPSGQTVYSLYAHLNSPASVNVGDTISQGQSIGEVGCTGSCTGPHVHLTLLSSLYQTTKNTGCRNYGSANPSKCYNPEDYFSF